MHENVKQAVNICMDEGGKRQRLAGFPERLTEILYKDKIAVDGMYKRTQERKKMLCNMTLA